MKGTKKPHIQPFIHTLSLSRPLFCQSKRNFSRRPTATESNQESNQSIRETKNSFVVFAVVVVVIIPFGPFDICFFFFGEWLENFSAWKDKLRWYSQKENTNTHSQSLSPKGRENQDMCMRELLNIPYGVSLANIISYNNFYSLSRTPTTSTKLNVFIPHPLSAFRTNPIVLFLFLLLSSFVRSLIFCGIHTLKHQQSFPR